MERKLKIAVIGVGGRGSTYSDYSLKHPEEFEISYACDIDADKLEKFAQKHKMDRSNIFMDADKMLEVMDNVDGIIISVLDNQHYYYTKKAMERGFNVLLEKAMSNNLKECIEMGRYPEKYSKVLMVCHVLRYTPFFSTIKQLLDKGVIGDLVSIQHNENVSYWHMAHSYVRGNFRNSDLQSPMILAKCCHDMDIMLWLVGRDCKKVSSFGSLSYFKASNAPVGSTKRCTDGCLIEESCPFSAKKIYLGENTEWPASMICLDMSITTRTKALNEGPYGRCVFQCDNNVVDHQVVNLLFDGGVTAAFVMNGFNKVGSRTIKLVGTKGEIRGYLEKNELEVRYFNSNQYEIINTEMIEGGHAGGDTGLMREFLETIRKGDLSSGLTSAGVSVQSHMMAFAAEESRLKNEVIDLDIYTKELLFELFPDKNGAVIT